jgi:hypothetical protein
MPVETRPGIMEWRWFLGQMSQGAVLWDAVRIRLIRIAGPYQDYLTGANDLVKRRLCYTWRGRSTGLAIGQP